MHTRDNLYGKRRVCILVLTWNGGSVIDRPDLEAYHTHGVGAVCVDLIN